MSFAELFDRAFVALPDLVRTAASAFPDRLAVVADDRSLTYAELDLLADRVAGALQRDGLRPGQTVALCAGNSAVFVAVYLGIVRAGAVAAPLPPLVARSGLLAMIGDSGAELLMLDSVGAGALAAGEGVTLPPRIALGAVEGVRSLEDWLAPDGARPTALALRPEDPCNIIYSSGTTGTPKGVVQSHAMRWTQLRLGRGLGDGAVMMISTPLYATGGSISLLMALGAGGTAVVMGRFDAQRFLQLAQRWRATHATLAPVQYRRIMDQPGFDHAELGAFRATYSIAAPSSAMLKAEILRRWPGGLIDTYGMTEGGGSCVLAAHERPDKLHTVGQPAPGHEIRIIDEQGAELPVGEVGEVVGRSAMMMSGYHNRPQATGEAEWFDAEGRRFIRTGDIGRLDDEGFLTIVDRKKDMIISGGFNIYPSDLEAVLTGHEQVEDAAVVGAPSERWGETPVGFVELRPGAGIAPAELLTWANARLGKVQRLSELRVVERLPRNDLGKLLKRALTGEIDGAPEAPE